MGNRIDILRLRASTLKTLAETALIELGNRVRSSRNYFIQRSLERDLHSIKQSRLTGLDPSAVSLHTRSDKVQQTSRIIADLINGSTVPENLEIIMDIPRMSEAEKAALLEVTIEQIRREPCLPRQKHHK